jgi:hypothetical protein
MGLTGLNFNVKGMRKIGGNFDYKKM